MEEKPLFSVITVSYNAGGVIRPTLESLACQSFRDFEYIVADGGSSDSTAGIISAYHDRIPAMSVVSEPDNGLYDAMNKGLERARGKYVVFLNAGDAFHSPGTLELYARAAASDPDIIYGDTVIVGPDRQFLRPRHLSAPEVLDFRSFSRGMLVCHQAFMLRRSLAPRYDTRYRFSADYDWCVRALREARTCVGIDAVAIDYLADGMTDRNHRASLLERFRIMCRHYGTFPTLLRHIGFVFRDLRRRNVQ